MHDFWIILSGALVAICCSLLGSLLLLKKASMLGDAISHAVLPGIVIAFYFSGERTLIPSLIGASVVGVLTTYFIQLLSNKIRMQTDASIGISYTFMFALGVLMISRMFDMVDLDQECVLYGEIAFVPFDLLLTEAGNLGPRAIWIMSAVLLLILTLLKVGYKAFKVTIFNPDYALSIGIPVALWHYVLMSGVSITAVVSFELVGAILVVGFLTIPAATAYLITTRLKPMLFFAGLFGILASAIGYYLAVWWNTAISATMCVASFGILLVVLLIKKAVPLFTKKEEHIIH